PRLLDEPHGQSIDLLTADFIGLVSEPGHGGPARRLQDCEAARRQGGDEASRLRGDELRGHEPRGYEASRPRGPRPPVTMLISVPTNTTATAPTTLCQR